MTVAAGAKTPARLYFAADGVIRLLQQDGSVTLETREKIGRLADWGGEIWMARAGMVTYGYLEQIKTDLEGLGPSPSIDAVFQTFANVIAPRLTAEAIAAGQPQPSQFIVGGFDAGASRLAVIEPNSVFEPEYYQAISIGGADPWHGHPIPWGLPIHSRRRGPKAVLLAAVRRYIRENPRPDYGPPLYSAIVEADGNYRLAWS